MADKHTPDTTHNDAPDPAMAALLAEWKASTGDSAPRAPGRGHALAERISAESGQTLGIANTLGVIWITRAGARHAMPWNNHAGPLAAGDSLATGDSPRSVLLAADGSRFICAPETEVSWLGNRGDKGPEIRIARGCTMVHAAKQDPEKPMTVRTPFGEVTVVGTSFEVRVNPKSGAEITVEHGEVHYRRASALEPIRLFDNDSLNATRATAEKRAMRREEVASRIAWAESKAENRQDRRMYYATIGLVAMMFVGLVMLLIPSPEPPLPDLRSDAVLAHVIYSTEPTVTLPSGRNSWPVGQERELDIFVNELTNGQWRDFYRSTRVYNLAPGGRDGESYCLEVTITRHNPIDNAGNSLAVPQHLVPMTFTYCYDADGNAVRHEADHFTETNPDRLQLLLAIVGSNPVNFFPPEAVQPGDSWSDRQSVSVAQPGNPRGDFESTFTFIGIERTSRGRLVARVDHQLGGMISGIRMNDEQGRPFEKRMLNERLSRIYFDPQTGELLGISEIEDQLTKERVYPRRTETSTHNDLATGSRTYASRGWRR